MAENNDVMVEILKEAKLKAENSKDKQKMINFIKLCVKAGYCAKCLEKIKNDKCYKCNLNYKRYSK